MESYHKLQICAQHAHSPLENEQLSGTSQNPAADSIWSFWASPAIPSNSMEEQIPAPVSVFDTPTTKGCNFKVEWELCDLDESCTKVCCEFVEVQDMLACWALEWKVCFTACSGGALNKSSQSQLMWKESGHAYIEKVLLSTIKVLPSWMLLINNCLVSLTALKFKIFTFYG